jgi:hypothetical protein
MFKRRKTQNSTNSLHPHAISTPEQIMQRLDSGKVLKAATMLREFAEPQNALTLLNKIINNSAYMPPQQYCKQF